MLRRAYTFKTLILAGVILCGSSGCDVLNLFAPPRTTDGGGGNLLTMGLKVVAGQLTTLTQDEMQILSDQIADVVVATNPGVQLPEMTNEQADAFLEFLSINTVPGSSTPGLNTIQDLQAFSEAASQNPDIVNVPDSLVEAYGDSIVDVDTSEVDIQDLFDQVLAGIGGIGELPDAGDLSTGGTQN